MSAANDGSVQSNEGWAVKFISPNLLEYVEGSKVCLINVEAGRSPMVKRLVHASESVSAHFPQLRERLQFAIGMMKGAYEVV